MNHYIKYFLLLSLVLSALSLNSNNPFIKNISKRTYQAGNKNWAINEDEKGFVYIANDYGLLVFDGIEWQLNSLPNKESVKSVYIKNHNTIYTGNTESFGVWKRNNKGILEYESLSSSIPEKEILNNEFWQVHEKGGNIYFQSFQAIYVLENEAIKRIGEPDPYLFLLAVGDELWTQKMKGALYRVKGSELILLPNTDALQGTDVRAIVALGDNKFLVGTSNSGLYIYNGLETRKWKVPVSDKMEDEELNCIIHLPNGNFLFGTITNGIYETTPDGVILSNYSTKNQLTNNTILSLFKAQNGSVWVGMDRGLANIQYLSNLSYYSFDQNDIGAIYDAKIWNDYLFICTNQGVFSIPQQKLKKTQMLTDMQLVDETQGQAWSLSIIDGKLYCGHNRGIKQIISSTKAILHEVNNSGVYSVEKDKLFNQDVWLISTYSNLLLIPPSRREIVLGYEGLPVKNALIDHLNNIWIKIPHKGIHKYRLSEDFKTVEDSLFLDDGLEMSSSYNLNMFKLGGRVIISKDGLFYTYDEISGQLSENKALNTDFELKGNIENIKKIKDNYYWIITSSSIHLLFYNGYETQILDQYALDTYDLSLVERYENVSILNDSLSLICLDNGFLIHNRREKKKEMVISPPSIELVSSKQIKTNELTYLPIVDNLVRVTAKQSDQLEILIHNPDAFYNNEYLQYKLSEIEEEWSAPLKSNTITFSRLPEGTYDLYVRSVGKLGEVSTSNRLTLQIEPPFYKSFLAILIYILLLMLIAYLVWQYILKRHRNLHLQKIRHRERARLKQLNSKLEDEILKVNSELFTRSNLILQKNKLFREFKDVLDDFYKNKKSKDLDQLYRSLSKIVDTDIEDEDNWEMILVSFEQKHPTFFTNLKKISPDLTPNDLRLCVCLRLNFSSKEISEMMNLSVRTVDNSRSRLRKKLNIPVETHLTEFLLKL